MGFAVVTIKYALFIFNILWAMLGILVIIFGCLGWGAMPQEHAIGIIILGSIILIISIFGCCGAIRESRRVLWTYVTLLLLLLVLIVFSIIFNTRDTFKNYAAQEVEKFWQRESIKSGSMDYYQRTYKCCGRNSAEDYIKIERVPPSSCCKNNNCINPLNLFVTGCLTRVEEVFSDERKLTQYFEWGLLGFNLIILTLAGVLVIHYMNHQRRYNY